MGDTAVGKSCLITNYLQNAYTDIYEPTVLDVYKGKRTFSYKEDGESKKATVKLEIHDTSGDKN